MFSLQTSFFLSLKETFLNFILSEYICLLVSFFTYKILKDMNGNFIIISLYRWNESKTFNTVEWITLMMLVILLFRAD